MGIRNKSASDKFRKRQQSVRQRTPHWRLQKDYVISKPLSRLRTKHSGIRSYVDENIPSVTTVIKPVKNEEVILTTRDTKGILNELKSTEELSTSIVAIPSLNERIVAIEENLFKVTHNGNNGNDIHYTVSPLDDTGKIVDNTTFVVNSQSGSVQTDEAEIRLLAVTNEKATNTVTITEPTVKKKLKSKGSTKEKVKTFIIAGLLALLLGMKGKPAEVCKVNVLPSDVTASEINATVHQPHNIVIPEIPSLGPVNSAAIANFEILQLHQTKLADALIASGLQRVEAANNAFRMGTVIEQVRNENVSRNFRKQIKVLDKNIKDSNDYSNDLSKENESLKKDLEDLEDRLKTLEDKLFKKEQDIERLEDNEDHLYRILLDEKDERNLDAQRATFELTEAGKTYQNLYDLQDKEISNLRENEDYLHEMLESSRFSEKQKDTFINRLDNIQVQKDKRIDEMNSVFSELNNLLADIKIVSQDTGNVEKDIVSKISELLSLKKDLDVKIIDLEASNVVSQQDIKDLKEQKSNLTETIETLEQQIVDNIAYHTEQISKLGLKNRDLRIQDEEDRKNALLQAEKKSKESGLKEGYDKGFAEGLIKGTNTGISDSQKVAEQNRKDLIDAHNKELELLKESHKILLNDHYVKGRKEVSDAIGSQVATLQQKLNLARRSSQSFQEWAAPHIRLLQLPNGKYEVDYNVEHISKISPLLKDYIADLAKQFEEEMNNKHGLAKGNIPGVVDLKITQRSYTSNGMLGKLRNMVFGPQQTQLKRYQMVYLASSQKVGENGRPAPYVYHDFMPLDPEDLAPYKELLEKAAAVTVTTVTTTLTNTKFDTVTDIRTNTLTNTKTETETVTATPVLNTSMFNKHKKTVVLPGSVTTVTEYVTPSASIPTATPSPFTETVTSTATVTETASTVTVQATETSTLTVTAQPTPTNVVITKDADQVIVDRVSVGKDVESEGSSEHSIIIPDPKATALVIETPETIAISTSTVTATITSADPETPSVTIQKVIPTITSDVEENLSGENTVSKTSVGENENKDNTVVKTETGEHSGCEGGAGMIGLVLKQTVYCVKDHMSKLEILKDLRIRGGKAPVWATPTQKAYVQNKNVKHPFPDDSSFYLNIVKSRKDWWSLVNWFANDNDSRSLEEMNNIAPEIFNTATFFKSMELEDLMKKRSKTFFGTSLSAHEKQWLEKVHGPKRDYGLEIFDAVLKYGNPIISPIYSAAKDIYTAKDPSLNTEPDTPYYHINNNNNEGKQNIPEFVYSPSKKASKN